MIMDNSHIFDEEEVEEFFDAREEILFQCSTSSTSSNKSGDFSSVENSVDSTRSDFRFDVWMGNPSSVRDRRDKFMKWMFGLDPDQNLGPTSTGANDVVCKFDSDNSVVLRSYCLDSEQCPSELPASDDNIECRNRNLYDDSGSRAFDTELSQLVTNDELVHCPDTSPFDDKSSNSNKIQRRRRRVGWLKKLGAVACIVDRNFEENDMGAYNCNSREKLGKQRVKVRSFGKQIKEFSGVYIGQNIKAHIGAIITMKFNPGGQYLASGGEDGVVRVWQAIECERDEEEVPDHDPSCMYFSVNHNSTLAPLHFNGESKGKPGSSRTTSDSACVIIPPEIFRISEIPLHSFHGHKADVLDLSWSKNEYLLSSSMDNSVRLWRVGCESCLRVFFHNNYVTCVQFNPVDESQFISGSIDGKVRIWEIPGCHVLDWTDIKQIVTAVCYRPDGKDIIVGSMSGNCLFYGSKDNHLQLEAHLSFPGKKKSTYKRITGFQFSPNDPQKVMVTSADSQIWILEGVDLLNKYKGLQNGRSQRSASFTADSRHIVSALEDSSIYIWSHKTTKDPPKPRHVKTSWTFERFFSNNALIAIPWNGFRAQTSLEHFTLSQEFLPKNLATWPEEKLPSSSSKTKSNLTKSQFKFLKASCQNTCHAWGQVIVTAGWDGQIRTFRNYGLPICS